MTDYAKIYIIVAVRDKFTSVEQGIPVYSFCSFQKFSKYDFKKKKSYKKLKEYSIKFNFYLLHWAR